MINHNLPAQMLEQRNEIPYLRGKCRYSKSYVLTAGALQMLLHLNSTGKCLENTAQIFNSAQNINYLPKHFFKLCIVPLEILKRTMIFQ